MKQTARATLVIASAVAESRRRWGCECQETFAISEVAERSALEQVMADLRPDVLVLDLTLPQLGRLRGLPHIQQLSLSTKMLVLTDAPAESEGIAALKAGAKGYYSRAIGAWHLKKAVEMVRKGEIWVQRKLIPSLVAEIMSLTERRQRDQNANPDHRLEGLTGRQRVVADLIRRGACNKEISSRLNIAERTVKAHLTETFRSLGVSDRLQLALLLNPRARLCLVAYGLCQSLPQWQAAWTMGA
jgi:two-component system, NarL family, nitrate/nitrite response regulator NarL